MLHKDIKRAQGALLDLSAQRVKSRLALKLRKLERRLGELAEDTQRVLDQLQEQYAKKDGEGKPVKRDGRIVIADREAHRLEVDSLLSAPVEGVDPIPIAEFEGLMLLGTTWASPVIDVGDNPPVGPMIELSNRQIYANDSPVLRAIRELTGTPIPRSLGLYVRRMLPVVEAQVDLVSDAHTALLEQYAGKTEDGDLLIIDGRYSIEDSEAFNDAYAALLDETFEVEAIRFDDLSAVGIDFAYNTWSAPFVAD